MSLLFPPNMRGSASPKGEARRERAAKPKQSAGRGREDYGWGWAGGVTKPNPPTSTSRTPQHMRGSASPLYLPTSPRSLAWPDAESKSACRLPMSTVMLRP